MANPGKSIIINGASGGIGAAIASILAEQNFSLALVGRDRDKLLQIKENLSSSNNDVEVFTVDAIEKDAIEQTIDNILQHFKSVYGFINSAGYVAQGGILDVTHDQWQTLFNLSIMSNVWFVSKLAKTMMNNKLGRIIFVNGVFSLEPSPYFIINGTLTGAIRNFAKALSKDLGRHNITVNTVNPGPTNTHLWQDLMNTMAQKNSITSQALNQQIVSEIPLGKIAEPQDVANCVAFLCSPDANYINGASFTVDGGSTSSC